MTAHAASIQDLWLYPVKSCRGIRVTHANLTATGLEFDRAWCVVDRDGVNVSQCEAISQRRMPSLAKIAVAFSEDRTLLLLDAPGMPRIAVPTALEGYSSEEALRVECSGKSTTTGGGWSLGFVEAKAHAGASQWLSEFLNREKAPGSGLVSGFKSTSRYALARSLHGLDMATYPPIFPLIQRAAWDVDYKQRFAGNTKRFSDFAPLLLVSSASARVVGEHCDPDAGTYPIESARGNIVVGGPVAPWVEETWGQIRIVPLQAGGASTASAANGLALRKIKECPRCTIPCRDPLTGDWLHPTDYLRLWKVLRKLFPRKDKDPEWGTWGGPFFGVYFGNGGQEGVLHVGDIIEVVQTVRWDAHLRWHLTPWVALGGGALIAAAITATAVWSRPFRAPRTIV